MRHPPAHSIRARELVSHTQAECKGAFFTRDPELKISLGTQGRPCKLPADSLSPQAVSMRPLNITEKMGCQLHLD
jgi:hypothetical protein